MRKLLLIFLIYWTPLGAFAQKMVVQPYLQPGNGSSLEGTDVKIITWITDQIEGDFLVEFLAVGGEVKTTIPERVNLDFNHPSANLQKTATESSTQVDPPKVAHPSSPGGPIALTLEELRQNLVKLTTQMNPPKDTRYFKYIATLTHLPFDSEVSYTVKLRGATLRQAKFRTRVSASRPTKFVMVGDLADGRTEQNAIAFQISRTDPDFLVALGDIVYSAGRFSEYLHHFWGTYNSPVSVGPKTGAPLMASIPFYPVIGNHDADVAKLPDTRDALAAFYFFHAPLNGPGLGPWNTPLGKDPKVAAAFRAAAGSSYPGLSQYSFDYGAGHFLILDTNSYNTASFMQLAPWIEKDLKETRQPWKFVCFHAPSFHTSLQHYTEQKMRLLEPIFASQGVSIVFAGHVHNYQRSKPLLFTPNPGVRDARGRVNGDFVFDDQFDGITKTVPRGVIHVVSGGGGATLYGVKDHEKIAITLQKENPGNYAPLTAKYFAEKNSFSLIELTPESLILKQISFDGQELDRFRITKPSLSE